MSSNTPIQKLAVSELLTRPEAAQVLRVKVGTLGQWAYRGVGPRFFRPDGGRALYRKSDLDAWLAGGEIVPGRVGLAEARP
jgi:excisionase family DNA binding protein